MIMQFFHIAKSVEDVHNEMPAFHSHPYYELDFLVKGSRSLFVNSKLFAMKECCVAVTAPYELHKFENHSYSRYLLCVSEEYVSDGIKDFLKMLSESSMLSYQEENWKTILKVLKRLLAIYESADDEKQIKISLHLGYLFYLMSFDYLSAVPIVNTVKNTNPLTLRIAAYLKEHVAEQVTLDELCTKFHISKSWLNKTFNKDMNCSVIDYHIKLKISQAKYYVRESSIPFNKIAASLGFSSANYFSIIFKKMVGVSPQSYRKNWLVNR